MERTSTDPADGQYLHSAQPGGTAACDAQPEDADQPAEQITETRPGRTG